MVAIPKIVGVISCGFLLCFGLSGNATSAADGTKAGQAGERIGGQAGRGYEPVQQIGEQAGRGYYPGKQERVPTHAGERIGGQAGLGYEQAERERIAAQ
jgi:hypothetical protein